MKLPVLVSVLALVVSLIALAAAIWPSIAVRHRTHLPKAKVVTLEYRCVQPHADGDYRRAGICPY